MHKLSVDINYGIDKQIFINFDVSCRTEMLKSYTSDVSTIQTRISNFIASERFCGQPYFPISYYFDNLKA
ncbi:uncharacterized protein MONOS_17438 [Monocercomonoides exilis]|uniref:uncharacterized protein n=1 Tax=Monocercomonoides exilis TaxID=2049356 RepID=UPI00355A76FF|nr:hypothetical protein MONOS_17438 [Monocercomonoides exilis]